MKVYDESNTVEKMMPAAAKSDEQLAAEANLNEAIPDLQLDDPGESDQTQQPIANAVDSLYGLFSILPIGLSFAGLKATAAVWSETTCHGLSAALVPVFRKYAWGQKIINFLETGAGVEELALAAVAFPIGMATYRAVLIDTAPPPVTGESDAIKPNPARSAHGIEMADESDIEFLKKDYEPRN